MKALPSPFSRVCAAVLLCVSFSSRICAAERPQYASASGPHLEEVGHLKMQKARTVTFSRNDAWIGQNLIGAEVLDIRNPSHPRRIQRFAPEKLQPLDFKMVDDDLLVVADRFRGLVLWNIHDLDNPTSLASLQLPGIATHVDVTRIGSKRIAALACAGEGVAAVDITNPREPKSIGQFATRIDYSRRIALDGNIGYLADHFDGGLKVLQFETTTAPVPLFRVRLRGFCEAISVRDSLLAVGYRNYGVRLFAIDRQWQSGRHTRDRQTTPSLRLLCTTVRTRSEVRDLLLLPGNLLVLANDVGGVELYDVNNPQLPLLLDEYEFDSPEKAAQSIQEHNGYIYVPSWDGGLYVLKIVHGRERRTDAVQEETE